MQFFLPTKFQVFCMWGTAAFEYFYRATHLKLLLSLIIDSVQCQFFFYFTGDLLIIMAQIIAAVQMVYEEKFVTRYSIPAMQAVGWEGN